MADITEEQNKIFQLLIQHPSKKYTTVEIANQLGITSSRALSEPYERLTNELDFLVVHGLIEFTIENKDSKYFISSN
jgi:hypothetical protein